VNLRERVRLTPLELASGYVFGEDARAPSLPQPPRGSLRAILEQVLIDALRSPPCVVTFSGGRDSSALLALAVHVARREGLPAPIAATSRFPEAPRTDESDWQERVAAHLGLEEWTRKEHTDELDVVGPVATALLRRRGLLWPANSHVHAPHAASARGGVLLTGAGGDQLFEPSRLARHSALLARSARPTARDLRRLAYVLAPTPLRLPLVRRRFPHPAPCPWLRPNAERRVKEGLQREIAREPVRAGARTRWSWRLRAQRLALESLDIVAEDAGTRMVHPFLDPGFLSALASSSLPVLDRGDAMSEIFGGLLPDDVLRRRTKGMFAEPLWNRHSRHFAARFTGEGVDETLVDVQGLRRFWSTGDDVPKFRSATLLQALWLAENARRPASADELEQASAGAVEHLPSARPAKLERR
jgi:asparagine synthetase B (glutamine-hydrolysing)